jgi:cytoskeleton protein RodZ
MEIGPELRRAREARGLSLQQIADATKIPISSLRALENDEFHRLPGGIFTRGFIRTYAANVGIDGERLARAHLAQQEEAPLTDPRATDTTNATHDALAGQRRSSTSLQIVLLILLTVGLLALLARSAQSPTSQESPAAVEQMEPTAGTSGLGALAGPVAASGTTAPSVRGASAAVAHVAPLRLEIHPRDVCWVTVTTDGQRVLGRLMAGGDRASVEARERITLRIGDAGAFAFTLNGVQGRPLGRPGEVLTIHITPENARAILTR